MANKKQNKNTPELGQLNSWFDFGLSCARKTHWDYFVIDQFLRGNHNVRGNPQDNTIEITRKTDSINYPINKVYTIFRAVRAYVTRHKPFVSVEADEVSEEAKTYARRSNRLLERDNQINNFRKLNKEWAYYGIKYGIGWRQVGYNQEKHVSIRYTIDPFDVLVGAKTGSYEDAPYIIKTAIRNVDYLKHRFDKSKADISPDNELAASEYKKLAMQIAYQDAYGKTPNGTEDTVVVKECWYRVFDENKYGGTVNKCIFTDNAILDFEETPYTEYPFIPYYSEVTPNEIWSDGHLKQTISPQRMFNLLNTQMLEYNHIVNRGRFLKDKNAGFKVINTREGQIIEHNPGKRVEVLNPPGVNPLLSLQLSLAQSFIEDIGGQHQASQGATPERVSSGAAIEALQVGDSNNIVDLRDNFEDALAKEASWILKMYSLFEDKGIVLSEEENNKDKDTYAVIGGENYRYRGKQTPSKYYMEDNGGYCDVCTILPDNKVKVSVSSQLGETRQARLNLMLKLVELGVISGKTVLEHLEFPNSTDILEKLAEEELAQVMLDKMKQPPMPVGPMPPPGAVSMQEAPPPPPPEDLSELEALSSELEGVLNG